MELGQTMNDMVVASSRTSLAVDEYNSILFILLVSLPRGPSSCPLHTSSSSDFRLASNLDCLFLSHFLALKLPFFIFNHLRSLSKR